MEMIDLGNRPVNQSINICRRLASCSSDGWETRDAGQKPPIDRDGFRRAIYTIDIGQNDLSAYMHLPFDQVLAKIPSVVAQIKYTIEVNKSNSPLDTYLSVDWLDVSYDFSLDSGLDRRRG